MDNFRALSTKVGIVFHHVIGEEEIPAAELKAVPRAFFDANGGDKRKGYYQVSAFWDDNSINSKIGGVLGSVRETDPDTITLLSN